MKNNVQNLFNSVHKLFWPDFTDPTYRIYRVALSIQFHFIHWGHLIINMYFDIAILKQKKKVLSTSPTKKRKFMNPRRRRAVADLNHCCAFLLQPFGSLPGIYVNSSLSNDNDGPFRVRPVRRRTDFFRLESVSEPSRKMYMFCNFSAYEKNPAPRDHCKQQQLHRHVATILVHICIWKRPKR